MPFWDERFSKMKNKYPEIETDQFHIDILAARFVLNPEWFDVVVASNLFGDILSDLGPACTGTIGIAPSGNINPPLANKKPGDIDMMIVRENTEGEYSSVGGKMYQNTDREIAIQETIMSAHGVDRVQKFAFELAKKRKRKKLTNATKSNGISITMPFWDERFNKMKKKYPEIETDQFHIDILAARFVLNPEWFDVVVASNLFGDILSDLGPACTGTIGIAPSGNINPENKFPSLFEPVHGSAPDIAGKGIANPVGQIWSGAMMLDYLGEKEASSSIVSAIEKSLSIEKNRTKDLGGKSNTVECSNTILSNL